MRGEQKASEAIARLSPESKVMRGPFEGMSYSIGQAAGSALLAKIIGSYEQELHPVMQEIIDGKYTDVVDIGCAEGYYAVGLAVKKPELKVWAFDTNAPARALCEKLAKENNVSYRVTVAGHCDAAALRKIPVRGKAVVICDCEGYEKALFSSETCAALAGQDLVIEIHDFLDPTISSTLFARLNVTHDVTRIPSIPDFVRPIVYPSPALINETYATQASLMAEKRPLDMEWFICRSKQ